MKEVDLNEVPVNHIVPLHNYFEGEVFYVVEKSNYLQEGDVYVSSEGVVTNTDYSKTLADRNGLTYYRANPYPTVVNITLPPSEKEYVWYVSLKDASPSRLYPCYSEDSAKQLARELINSTGETYYVLKAVHKFEIVPAEVKETVLEKTYTFSNKVVFAPPGVGSL